MLEANPTLIQPGPPGPTSRAPLVLIHDGSGLISSYFWLGSLSRKVFGIFNPRFEGGGKWDDGVPEIAREYALMIKSVIPKGRILLGGWSFGGLLSLEIARCLLEDSNVSVIGLIMIDSPYPRSSISEFENFSDEFFAPEGSNPALQLKLQQCIQTARQMIRDWDPPSWHVGSSIFQESKEASENISPLNASLVAMPLSVPPSPPPAILLKAAEYVPNQDGTTNGIDVYRKEKRLGWENYEHNFIRVALDIKGNHYSVFAQEKAQQLTTKMNMACAMLDPRC
ncbi:alpha/beta-hydrolase [Hyaloscypha bicolor E]|uniref:Alpha/beta-hydrolase n=1 Tax=Hyaloscypha bicolor E TaxID=1095630 RepID=A0A2J6SI59_9HELO|nr:alpha/beta-hydrolase [Hyaloscypha bicolor E]PMD50454.1 alpha/beta-hydrolase [Hyaloscypha bicolor E]